MASEQSEFKQKALTILVPIKKTFMKELRAGLKEGPYETLDICHLKAPHIAEGDFNEAYDVGRTSDKIRNKNNAPKAWLQKILKDYVGSNLENPKTGKVYQVKKKLAYVEPIYTKTVCLKCHGKLKGSVKKKIESLYPNDMATNYKIGEFRGLFYIKQK
jgi:hypothetical protein